MTNFRLHDEQTVNGLRKIAWGSFSLWNGSIYIYKYCRYIYINVYVALLIYIHIWKMTTFICLLHIRNRNDTLPFIFCWRKMEVCFPWMATINGNRRLLFQQTCPSMPAVPKYCPWNYWTMPCIHSTNQTWLSWVSFYSYCLNSCVLIPSYKIY